MNRNNRILYGSDRKDSVVEHLTAGPVRLKFQDGELRYLYVGQREIVRRIYFALRDPVMDTIMPTLSQVEVTRRPDGFRIAFKADYNKGPIDYSATAEIDGQADGTITFRVDGKANAPFQSPRIGLNVLYGDTLAGTRFEVGKTGGKTVGKTGTETDFPPKADLKSVSVPAFPHDIPTNSLADKFQTLQYTTDGMTVACSIAGGIFSMEDQRVFGDSSYKAYGAIPYAYPEVGVGDKPAHIVTVKVAGAKPDEVARRPSLAAASGARIVIGKTMQGVKLPRQLGPRGEPPAGSLTMSYSPALHLFDDDMLIENPPALAAMVRFRRSQAGAAPGAPFVISPATMEPPYPRSARDPRNDGMFAAAWAVHFLKCAALAGADAVRFDLGMNLATVPSFAARELESLADLGGCELLETTVEAIQPAPVDALAINDPRVRPAPHNSSTVVYLVNKTDQPQQVTLSCTDQLDEPSPTMELAPFEVRRVHGS